MNFLPESIFSPQFEDQKLGVSINPLYIALMVKTKVSKKTKNIEPIKIALQREFIGRCQKNPAYSMRAFAKYLDMDQSFLSKLMRGQRSITTETALSITNRLGLTASDLKLNSSTYKDTFLPLVDDEFSVISEWYHFALIELAKTKTFKPEPVKIAKRLGIHAEEARAAISRLQRIGLIRLENGNFSLNSPDNTWSSATNTSDAKKLLQKRLLQRGIDAIENVPLDLRENGSLTVAVDKKRLPEFKERLRQIRQELGDFFQPNSDLNLDEVYQLTVAFYPLTKIEGDSK